MSKRKTHEQFVQELKTISPELTVLTKYENINNHIIVEDNIGIKYSITPAVLLNGGKPILFSALDRTEAFKIRLKHVQPELVVISDYINTQSFILVKDKYDITYRCIPSNLLRGARPFMESAVNPTEAFQSKLNIKNPGLTVISEYTKGKNKILVKDTLNIVYSLSPNHLMRGNRVTIESAIDKNLAFTVISDKKHKNFYDYSKVNYIDCMTKVTIICPDHGEFTQEPREHTSGAGCRKCSSYKHQGGMHSVVKYNPEQKIFMYLFECYNDSEKFYKIGLSANPRNRATHIPYKVNIIAITEGYVKELFNKEQNYCKILKEKKLNYIPLINFNGYSECFK